MGCFQPTSEERRVGVYSLGGTFPFSLFGDLEVFLPALSWPGLCTVKAPGLSVRSEKGTFSWAVACLRFIHN